MTPSSWLSIVPVCDSYSYQAALICEECADEIMGKLRSRDVEDTGDSGDFPQANLSSPECDSPPHCDRMDKCLNAVQVLQGRLIGCPLSCALTDDGYEYVVKSISEHILFGTAHQRGMALLWRHLYSNYLQSVPLIKLTDARVPPNLSKKLHHLTKDSHLVVSGQTYSDLKYVYGGAHNQYHTTLWRLTVSDSGGFTDLSIVQLPPSEYAQRPLDDMLNEAVSEDAWE